MFVRNNLFLFCAETSAALIMIGSTPSASVMIFCASFGIDATFSRMNRFGFVSFKMRTYSRNNQERSPSSHLRSFFAIDKSWHGLQPIRRSGDSLHCNFVTSPSWTISDRFFCETCIAYLSISLAKYFSTFMPARSSATRAHDIQSNRDNTIIFKKYDKLLWTYTKSATMQYEKTSLARTSLCRGFFVRKPTFIDYIRKQNRKIWINFKSKKRRPKPSRFVAHTPRVQGILCGIPKLWYRIPYYMQTDVRISFTSLIRPLPNTFSLWTSNSITLFMVSILLWFNNRVTLHLWISSKSIQICSAFLVASSLTSFFSSVFVLSAVRAFRSSLIFFVFSSNRIVGSSRTSKRACNSLNSFMPSGLTFTKIPNNLSSALFDNDTSFIFTGYKIKRVYICLVCATM